MEDFDPAKAIALGQIYHPDLPEDQVREKVLEFLTQQSDREYAEALEWAKRTGAPVRESLSSGALRQLVRLEADGTPVYVSTMNTEAAMSLQTDLVRNVSPYSVNGSNGTGRFNIGLWEVGGVRATHKSLTGRVTLKNTPAVSDHATHVAGTLAASAFYPLLQGMAPNAQLLAYDVVSDTTEMFAEAQTSAAVGTKILVSNHSYGIYSGWVGTAYQGDWPSTEDSKFGRYTSHDVLTDLVCINAPYYLPFFAAGNERSDAAPANGATFSHWTRVNNNVVMAADPTPYNSAIHPGSDFQKAGYDTINGGNTAKNAMVVGAVGEAVNKATSTRSLVGATMSSFSSWGPTDDGRLKPDIVANGVNVLSCGSTGDDKQSSKDGTSMATPNACGSALLLQELYSDKFNGVVMRASTLKGLIIHTADDLGNTGPDYSNGWGLMNTKAAADVILAHKDAPGNNHLVEGQVTNTQTTQSYNFEWDGANPIRVTLCWTDPMGVEQLGLNSSTRVLVNDLDLRITGPGGTSMPYILNPANPSNTATTGDNIRDNVEQILVASPLAGTYTVTVSYKGTLQQVNNRQNFSLVQTGLRSDAPVIKLSRQQIVLSTGPSSSPGIETFTLQNAGSRTLNYSISDDATWININPVSGSLAASANDTVFLGFATTTLSSGTYTGRVRITGPGAAPAEVEVKLTVTGNTVGLAGALDIPGTTIINSGAAPWFGQTSVTHDGADAARSAPIGDSKDSAFSINVAGPGELKFWWKVDCEAAFDELRFEIGTTLNTKIDGNVNWTQVTVPIAAGAQKLTWRYKKGSSTAVGADAGWVDEVAFTPFSNALILSQTKFDLNTAQSVSPAPISFDVKSESGTVPYTIKSSKTWLIPTPASGSSAGESDPISCAFNVTGLLPGLQTARLTITPTNGTPQFVDVNLTILEATPVPLHTALDYGTSTSFSTNSTPANRGWFGLKGGAFDLIDCARSGTDVPDSANSSLILGGVAGPGTITFYWRTDCEDGYDKLLFQDGASVVATTTGLATPWKQVSHSFGAGTHTFIWKYSKDASNARGQDCGFIDKVVISTTTPQLNVTPLLLTASGVAGTTVLAPSFQISNIGAGTLAYSITTDQPWCKVIPVSGTAKVETDTIALSIDATTLAEGTWYANVTINGGVAGTKFIPLELTLSSGTYTPVVIPPTGATAQNFTAATLPKATQGWGFFSSDEGRIAVVAGALRMDDKVPGSLASLNEAVLHANLTGQTNVKLSFKHRISNDEPNATPSTFTNHFPGDGVCISADGVTWHLIRNLASSDANFSTHVIDLDAAIAGLALSYTSDFQIKFQQYDESPWGTDGAEFDDITLTVTPSVDDHSNDFAGATPVVAPSTTNGKIEISGDQDFFQISIGADSDVTISSTGALDTLGDLYDSAGNLLNLSNDGVGKNFLIRQALRAGTYFVRVRGNNGAKGLYTLAIAARSSTSLDTLTPPSTDWTPYDYMNLTPIVKNFDGVGLIKTGNGATLNVLGSINAKVLSNGSFTGKIIWDNVTYGITGIFVTNTFTGTVARTGNSPLTYTMAYHFADTTSDNEHRLRGTISDGITTADIDITEKYVWDASGYTGFYTIVLPGVRNGSPLEPQGTGIGSMSVLNTGAATLTFALADGSIASAGTHLTYQLADDPEILFFTAPTATGVKGHLAGNLRFRNLASISDADGYVTWKRLPFASTTVAYPNGFHLSRRLLASRFTTLASAPDLSGLILNNAQLRMDGGNVAFVPDHRTVTWSNLDKLTLSITGETWAFAYLSTSARVTGTFKHTYTGSTFGFQGVVFQKQNKVAGYFMAGNQSGMMTMAP